jgi:hypothetical protein
MDEPLASLAERALASLAPLRFGLASGDGERDAVLRMRAECILAQGWARPEDLTDGVERDEHDGDAIFVVCHDEDGLAGSLRIVAPHADHALPTERAFGIRARPQGGVADVGRVIVAPRVRAGQSHRILGGLCARGWLELAERGLDQALSSATPELVELYRAVGLRVTVLGPARDHWGARRAPVQVAGDSESFAFLTAAAPP